MVDRAAERCTAGRPRLVQPRRLRADQHQPRASEHPLTPGQAWRRVEDWLACDTTWIPNPTDAVTAVARAIRRSRDHHARVLGRLVTKYELRGNLVSDAAIAALAIEHGLTVCSADTDFARFEEIRWIDPLTQ
jgi:predicted nucleic acid-binding protein